MDGVLCRYNFPRRLEVMAKRIGVTASAIELFGARAFFSCEFGTGKEGTAVFALVLERIGATPAETPVIDDSAEYIDNARAAGLNVHHFRGIDPLLGQLAALGLGQGLEAI